MLEGTKKLFPSDYMDFVETMVDAADSGDLPIGLQLQGSKDFTLNDFQDFFLDFKYDTGLDITGTIFLCPDCGELHLLIEVNYPGEDEEEPKLLQ